MVKQGIRQIWETEIEGTKGFNQIRWDGVVKQANVPEAYFFQYKTYIDPEKYTVKLTGQGFSEQQDFTVLEARKYE